MSNTNRRAKKEARARQKETGERYTVAFRRTRRQRQFIDDHCANCLMPLPDEIRGLFCSPQCMQTARAVRYMRSKIAASEMGRDDIRYAVKMKMAFLPSGGYHERDRSLSATVRNAVWLRDEGKCRECGGPGVEVDHIHDDASVLDNLQLLCLDCHHAKTEERLVPSDGATARFLGEPERIRVRPAVPARLWDDQNQWQVMWRELWRVRKERMLERLEWNGVDRSDVAGWPWADLIELLHEQEEEDYAARCDDHGWHDPSDDDGGYGPNSYFVHAMAKD
jgi:hypothetical protein